MLHQRQRLPQVCCVKTQTSPETPWFDELDIVEGSWRCDEPAIRLLCTCGRLFYTLNIPSMSDEHKVISTILKLPCRSFHLPEPPVQTRRSQQDHSVPTCSGTTPHVLHLPCCQILLCHVHTLQDSLGLLYARSEAGCSIFVSTQPPHFRLCYCPVTVSYPKQTSVQWDTSYALRLAAASLSALSHLLSAAPVLCH